MGYFFRALVAKTAAMENLLSRASEVVKDLMPPGQIFTVATFTQAGELVVCSERVHGSQQRTTSFETNYSLQAGTITHIKHFSPPYFIYRRLPEAIERTPSVPTAVADLLREHQSLQLTGAGNQRAKSIANALEPLTPDPSARYWVGNRP